MGWLIPDPASVERALEHTLFAVCIERNGACIGSGRVVGDGALVFCVQDVIVLPEHQRKGYGALIMDAIMAYIEQTAHATAFIGLFAAKGLEPWYARYGFIKRPQQHLGPGMGYFKT